MTVNTQLYRDSNGHNPKPSQRGMWVFGIERNGSVTTITATDTYCEALRRAKAEAKMIGGASAIHVYP
jgi:hypothetical protein